jgi:NAD(P)-dependent dehydrogenase (short-subunit alcohol dehydrogenase family)
MTMDVLREKVAIVTGASSGIGRASAKLFAQEGAKVIVAARRQQELEILVDEIARAGGTAVALAGDVADERFAKALVDIARTRFGGLDIGFNNAGTLGALRATPDVTVDEWDEAMRTNLTSAFLAAKHQIPAMLERHGGALVFTSTFVGHAAGFSNMAAYAASKAGLIGLTRALAAEVGAHGIRVNALLPGGTDTPMGRAVASSPEALDFVRGLHALKRIASPEEIARSALYLVSDASSFTTGTALFADGGASMFRA